MVKRWFSLMLLMIPMAASAATDVIATVDQNPVFVGQSFILQVVANDEVRGSALDLSTLEGTFRVGNTSTRHATQIINQTVRKQTVWTTPLTPIKAGLFTIPAIEVDGAESVPIPITVMAQGQGSDQLANRDIYIEVTASQNEVYLQQPFVYNVKLFLGVEVTRGSLTEPSFAEAQVSEFDKDSETMEVINGRRYRVYNRNYLMTPQKSGEFEVESPTFDGEMVVQAGRSTRFSSMGQSKPVQRFGPKTKITVKPIPFDYRGQWLPAELVTIHDEISPEAEFKVGEPITRTITLSAAGNGETQIPELKIDYPQGLNVYPDQAQTHQTNRGNTVIAQRVESTAIIATQPGTVELPEVKVSWFNVILKKTEYATLPARTIEIAANPNAVVSAPIQVAPSNLTPTSADNMTNSGVEQIVVQEDNYLYASMFAVLWLLTLLGWFGHVRRLKQSTPKSEYSHTPKATKNKAGGNLDKVLKMTNPSDIAAAVIAWGTKSFPQHGINSLADVQHLCSSEEITAQLSALQGVMYGNKESSVFDVKKLVSLLRNLDVSSKQSAAAALSPLHLSK